MSAWPAAAQILPVMQSGDWQQARALAAADPNLLATPLVEYLRILNAVDGPDRPPASDIARFIDQHPGWPDQPALNHRLADAITDAPDLRDVAALCASHSQTAPASLARCAEAQALAGAATQAAASARVAWTGGLVQDEEGFFARWGSAFTPADQWARFQRLAGDDAAATRQIPRLDKLHSLAAQARLAFRHDDPGALTALAFVAPSLRSDPALLLEEARSLRRTGALSAALALWQGAGFAAEAGAPPAGRPPFWTERDILARKLLALGTITGDAASALSLADDHALEAEQAVDARFLAGWILLRRLHDPAGASLRFAALATSSRSAITSARAQYWLGRAASAQGAATLAAQDFAKAATWPTTFYGQQAVMALGQDPALRIAGLTDPAIDPLQAQALAGKELARAARLLVAWGDGRRARSFVLRLTQDARDAQDFAACADLALKLGLPETAVAVARLAGHDGAVLPQRGWPSPFAPPASEADPALALAIMRQESSFDPAAVSPAGAQGLMQMMQATARQIGGAGALDLRDPTVNMRLGTAYLDRLLQQFGGVIPTALAAYNAGPRRARDWIAVNGDITGAGQEAVIDWIELIPFGETRNYVQRVMESATIYRAKRTPPP